MQLAQEELVFLKGKRSKRPRLSLTMATSSSTTADSGGGFVSDSHVSGSCNSSHGSKHIEEEEDMAKCLILLAKGAKTHAQRQAAAAATVNKAEGTNYQCKTCNKSFPSFQALGGHRASHKKPTKAEEKKGITDSIKQENSTGEESTILSLQIQSGFSGSPQSKTLRVHECSICGAEFASGQALGGHMRRHRPMARVAPLPDGEGQEGKRQRNLLSLDLNLPAPEDNDHRESKFPFASKEQVIVFSASPLVDCHIY